MELTICRAIEVLSGDFSNIEFAKGESHSDAFAEAFRMAVASLKQKRDYATRFSADDYQVLAERTINRNNTDASNLKHGIIGLSAEAGEVASLLQKYYQGHPFDYNHLRSELGDCLWMIAEVCTMCGWDMSEIMAMNISKLKARYPNGFSAEKSLHRKDGDI